LEKARLLRFARKDRILNRDLGISTSLAMAEKIIYLSLKTFID
jgi:hypothetical protein